MDWPLIWGIWVGVTLVSFGILEFIGWKQKRTSGTLSYQVWKILFVDHHLRLVGKHPRKPRGIIYFLVGAPIVWLAIHFLFGGRFG